GKNKAAPPKGRPIMRYVCSLAPSSEKSWGIDLFALVPIVALGRSVPGSGAPASKTSTAYIELQNGLMGPPTVLPQAIGRIVVGVAQEHCIGNLKAGQDTDCIVHPIGGPDGQRIDELKVCRQVHRYRGTLEVMHQKSGLELGPVPQLEDIAPDHIELHIVLHYGGHLLVVELLGQKIGHRGPKIPILPVVQEQSRAHSGIKIVVVLPQNGRVRRIDETSLGIIDVQLGTPCIESKGEFGVP